MSAIRAVVPPNLHSATSLRIAAWMISSSMLLKTCLMASCSLLSSEAGALLALKTAGSLQCADAPSDGHAKTSMLMLHCAKCALCCESSYALRCCCSVLCENLQSCMMRVKCIMP